MNTAIPTHDGLERITRAIEFIARLLHRHEGRRDAKQGNTRSESRMMRSDKDRLLHSH